MKKLCKVVIVCLLLVTLMGCQTTEKYLKKRQELTDKFVDEYIIVNWTIRDTGKEDGLNSDVLCLFLDQLVITCEEVIELKPPKEFEKYHKLWSQYMEETINMVDSLKAYAKTEDPSALAEVAVYLEVCSELAKKAHEEFQKVVLDKVIRDTLTR